MSLTSIGYREVEKIVSTWTDKYQHHISLMDTKPDVAKYKSIVNKVYGLIFTNNAPEAHSNWDCESVLYL